VLWDAAHSPLSHLPLFHRWLSIRGSRAQRRSALLWRERRPEAVPKEHKLVRREEPSRQAVGFAPPIRRHSRPKSSDLSTRDAACMTASESMDADSRGSNANVRGYPSALGSRVVASTRTTVIRENPRTIREHPRPGFLGTVNARIDVSTSHRTLATAALMALDAVLTGLGRRPPRANDYESHQVAQSGVGSGSVAAPVCDLLFPPSPVRATISDQSAGDGCSASRRRRSGRADLRRCGSSRNERRR